MSGVPELFGSYVFNDEVMRNKLPKDVYKSLKRTIDRGEDLDINVANVVANAMKDWAVELGATHFTHWFQPLTGITAEKHDSFITPTGSGKVIMDFSGKELIKGEPDASSFPSGGLRATFEARGYTAWDPTSYAFVKDGSLFIPTVFCSYGGEALDKKTPLLHSMEAISDQAMRILKLFGNTTARRVNTTVGPEQEYFLVDKEYFDKRKDLFFCGRTLFGAMPPKGQEMDDHYFGTIKPRVAAYMKDLDEELWKLGILAKTKHNEVAPAQHELAPIFTTTNIATDHNQLTMEIMKKVAAKHGLVCLLHEKPFAGVNGSGKHNNWSISTDTGVNLLDPGKTPYENAQFLLFLVAVIKAIDEYQDLLRISVSSAGNDHRLGANEAPPAVVSMFLGDELQAILEALESGKSYDGSEKKTMEIGVHVLPSFPKDTTDRNRTSPFAFTGNKFEFRALGSSQNIATANISLNAAMACALDDIASMLEAELAQGTPLNAAIQSLLAKLFAEHMPIVFDGNGYSDEWLAEAEKRGLPNLKDTVAALAHYSDKDVMAVFERHGVLSPREMLSRQEILLENYTHSVSIEGHTALKLGRTRILPVALAYQTRLAKAASSAAALVDDAAEEKAYFVRVREQVRGLMSALDTLEAAVNGDFGGTALARAAYARDTVLPAMNACRNHADALECLCASHDWPLPSYAELLWLH